MIQIRGSHSRLGERVPVNGLTVTWRHHASHERRRWRRSDDTPEIGEVIDLSASGARIAAPDNKHLEVGTLVDIGIGDARAVVRIRHRHHRADGLVEYGTEFVKVHPELDQVFGTYLRGRP